MNDEMIWKRCLSKSFLKLKLTLAKPPNDGINYS